VDSYLQKKCSESDKNVKSGMKKTGYRSGIKTTRLDQGAGKTLFVVVVNVDSDCALDDKCKSLVCSYAIDYVNEYVTQYSTSIQDECDNEALPEPTRTKNVKRFIQDNKVVSAKNDNKNKGNNDNKNKGHNDNKNKVHNDNKNKGHDDNKNNYNDDKNNYDNDKNNYDNDKNNYNDDKNNYNDDKNNYNDDKNNYDNDKNNYNDDNKNNDNNDKKEKNKKVKKPKKMSTGLQSCVIVDNNTRKRAGGPVAIQATVTATNNPSNIDVSTSITLKSDNSSPTSVVSCLLLLAVTVLCYLL